MVQLLYVFSNECCNSVNCWKILVADILLQVDDVLFLVLWYVDVLRTCTYIRVAKNFRQDVFGHVLADMRVPNARFLSRDGIQVCMI